MKKVLYGKFNMFSDSDELTSLFIRLNDISNEIDNVLKSLNYVDIYEGNRKLVTSEKVKRYLSKYDSLDDENTILLRRLFEQYHNIRDEIFYLSSWIVTVVVNDYCFDYDFPVEDIIQYGNLILLRTIEKYNVQDSNNFSVYASMSIYGGLLKKVVNSISSFEFPDHIVESYNKIRNRGNYLSQSVGREVTRKEIANDLNVTSLWVDNVVSNFEQTVEYNDDTYNMNEDDTLSLDGKRKKLLLFLKSILLDRQYFVLVNIFGLEGTCYSETELAKFMNISRQRVNDLKKQALIRIRRQKERFIEEFKD